MKEGRTVFAQFRPALSRRLSHSSAQLLRPVSSHGLCPVDGPREFAPHGDLSEDLGPKAIPRGFSRFYGSQHLSRGQRKTRLAHFLRFRCRAHPTSQAPLCPGIVRRRAGASRLRFGFDHHRALLEFVPLGPISPLRSRDQDALLDLKGNLPQTVFVTPARLHDVNILDRLSFEPGAIYIFDRAYLDFGSPSPHSSGSGFLHYPGPSQFPLSTALFSSGGIRHRSDLRSDHSAAEFLSSPRLSRSPAPHPLPGSSASPASDFLDQQFPSACLSDRPTVSVSLADRTLLQEDQTTLADQSIFRNFGERRQNADLGRHPSMSWSPSSKNSCKWIPSSKRFYRS